MPAKTPVRNRIFIGYRRSDTRGFAGRLEDSLKVYFGKERIFRDVGSIEPGTDFVQRIGESLDQAGAFIVLIGPSWLVNNDEGKSRLHDPDDHVAGEIAAALEKGIPVFPVLVEGATMPRAEDLPERLADLSRRNAVTISDERWKFDVTRLAKVLALDISGSVMERRLTVLKAVVLSLSAASMLFTLLSFSVPAARALPAAHQLFQVGPNTTADADAEPASVRPGASEAPGWFGPPAAAVNFVAIVVVSLLLVGTRTWIERDSRRFIWATVVVGLAGTLGSFVYYTSSTVRLPTDTPVTVVFAASTCTITVMLVLMAMSGFNPNDSVE